MQAQIGEVIGWRNLFWSLTDAMACNPDPWVDGAVLPNVRAGAPSAVHDRAYPRSVNRRKGHRIGADLSSPHARDFKNPEIDKYLARYVRGSTASITKSASRR